MAKTRSRGRPTSRGAARGAKRPTRAARGPARSAAPARPRRAPSPRKAPPGPPAPAALLDAGLDADVVSVPARVALAIDGAGGPEQVAFGRAVGALYGVAYGLKFSRKRGGRDFGIGPLEGRWWAEGVESRAFVAPRERWRWRLRLAVPSDVDEHELADVIQAATMKKGGKLEGSAEARHVALERIPAGTLGRVLHLGPYAEEERSFAEIRAAMAAAGRSPGDAHLEVYLSDPRRTRPEKLRTVLLLETTP